jgi:hypothetical protein
VVSRSRLRRTLDRALSTGRVFSACIRSSGLFSEAGLDRPFLQKQTKKHQHHSQTRPSRLSLSLSLSALSKEPGFDDKREARKSFEKFLFFFLFLTQDCLNPMLESTYFFQRKGKKDTKEAEDFPLQTTIPFV